MTFRTENAMLCGATFGCLDDPDLVTNDDNELVPIEQTELDPDKFTPQHSTNAGGVFGVMFAPGELDLYDRNGEEMEILDDEDREDDPSGHPQQALAHDYDQADEIRRLALEQDMDDTHECKPMVTGGTQRHAEFGTDKIDGGRRYKHRHDSHGRHGRQTKGDRRLRAAGSGKTLPAQVEGVTPRPFVPLPY